MRAVARAAALILLACGLQAHAATVVPVDAVDAIDMTVADLDRSVDFYARVLTFETTSDERTGDARVARMRLGKENIQLTEFSRPRGRAIPADSRANDRWFQHIAIVVSDMDRAYRRLREQNVRAISAAPQLLPTWNPNAGGISAFYFEDPDGHPVELIHFPRGKGDPRWQAASDRLFLGIDHTAITVASTEPSLRFYRDRLGFRVAGGSENYGPEQERLSGVPGARVRITSLRARRGPGVELLEYEVPRDGRPLPADSRASDLVHHEILVKPTAPLSRSLLLDDPDGHVVEVER